MPATLNGIGTHYYGQKNVEPRPGPCPHCGANVMLTSYDTRLWFVVVFIPIIPLGRKRIVDKCPSCTRHYAMDADKWETSKQLEISGAEEVFRRQPTPENAIAVHRQMVQFHQFEAAAAFRKTATEQFPASANLQAHFGAALEHFGKLAEAEPYFARALELRPDLPEARAAVAMAQVRAGRLDAARLLLDFLEKPGAAQLYSLAPLEHLATAYQGVNRHEDALGLFATLLEGLPAVGDVKAFRQLVAKSEKALGRNTTILPKKKFSWRGLFSRGATSQPPALPRPGVSTGRALLLVGTGLGLIALIMAVANEYTRRHRTLEIVNAFNRPATIELTGPGGTQKLDVRWHDSVTIAEGQYHAVITGPWREEVDFEVRTPFWDRWSGNPLWVLNVGGAAILLRTTAVYSANNPPPPTTDFHFGRTFEHYSTVTHPFQDLPQTVQLKRDSSRTLVGLQAFTGKGVQLIGYFLNTKPGEALDVAEAWLRAHPNDGQALQLYRAVALDQKAAPRAVAYLRRGLAARPVQAEWHRAYQSLFDTPANHSALVAEYDALLRAAPTDSALLYLRGRLADDRASGRSYFEQAAKADAKNTLALYALAFDHMAAAAWPDARPLLARAVELQPDGPGYEPSLHLVRLALGETAALEQEARERLKRNPLDSVAVVRLVEMLALHSRGDETLKVADDFARALAKEGEPGRIAAAQVRTHALYVLGDFAAIEKAEPFRAYAEQGRLAEAAAALAKDDTSELPYNQLALAVSASLAGNPAETNRWLAAARQRLSAGDIADARAAAWLGDTAPTVAEARDAALPPRLKALLLAATIARHPEARATLAPLARALNVEPAFPYHLLRRATAP